MAVLGRDNKGKITYRDSKGEVIWDKGAVSSKGSPNLNLLDLLLRCSPDVGPSLRFRILRSLRTKSCKKG